MNGLVKIDQQMETKLESLSSIASKIKVVDNSSRGVAQQIRQDVKTVREAIVGFFKPHKTKAWELHKGLCAHEKSYLDRVDAIELPIAKEVKKFDLEQEQIRRKQEEDARREEERKAAIERRKLEQAAARTKDPEKKEIKLAQAEMVAPAAVVIPTRSQAIEGEQIRKIWKAELVDKAALVVGLATDPKLREHIEGMVEISQGTLNRYARVYKEQAVLPGVRFFEDIDSRFVKPSGSNGEGF